EGDRDDVVGLERLDGLQELVPGGRLLGPGRFEHVVVVVHDDGLGLVVRDGVDLVVDHAGGGHGGQDAVDEGRGVLGEVHDRVVRDVLGQGGAGPTEDEGGRVAGADRGADLLLVGVVREVLGGELVDGVGFVHVSDGGGHGLFVASGQSPCVCTGS